MKRVHITLQGKGGVGKSMATSWVAQYLLSQGRSVLAIDTDPVNRTFGGYPRFNAIKLPLLTAGRIDDRRFDAMMENIMEHPDEVVIDSGASTFLPLTQYLLTQGTFEMMAGSGREVMIHTVIAGDQALRLTLSAFQRLAELFAELTRLTVWLNAYFGPIDLDGLGFEQMDLYKTYESRIHGLVHLEKPEPVLVQPAVSQMLKASLTYEEAIVSEEFRLMDKQRLTMMQRRMFEQLQVVVG